MSKKATFAGGCFWCMVKPYTAYEGVEKVVSGFTGGEEINPSYNDVVSGNTGHYEAVEIYYNEEKISYKELLKIFWMQIDPFDEYGQFVDRGEQYKTAIFYHDEEQRQLALDSIEELEKASSGNKVVTKLIEAKEFYPAEEGHQNYFKKNARHYSTYYKESGRYNYIKSHWDRKNKDREALAKKLTNLQFEVTQNDMTEIPFENEYFNNFEKGIYVDVTDGTPLFSSKDKFDAGCGWPAFTKPIDDRLLLIRTDYIFGMVRTEVRSFNANSHLGHIFEDELDKEYKNKYCINSASLKFIPYDKMEEYGYNEYKSFVE